MMKLLDYEELELLFCNACTIIFILLMVVLAIMLSFGLVMSYIDLYKKDK